MFTSASTGLKNIINPRVNTAGGIGVIYEYEEPKPSAFPCIIIIPKSGEEVELDTASDELKMVFTMRVTDNPGLATGEARMKVLCDSMLTVLRSANNQTLAGTALRIRPFQVSWGWVDTPSPMRFFEIEVQVTELVVI